MICCGEESFKVDIMSLGFKLIVLLQTLRERANNKAT